MLKLCFYVPVEYAEAVKGALFNAGAGRIGHYDCCAWQTPGQGQFRALEGANPTLGVLGEIERVPEFQVEMVLEDVYLQPVIKALKQAHPYEEPAFGVFQMLDVSRL